MRRERCAVCRKKIRRPDADESTYWFGPAQGDGMAQMLVAREACYAKVTADMHASARERALLLANTMGRARYERSEISMDGLQFIAFLMASEGTPSGCSRCVSEPSRSRTTTSSASPSSASCRRRGSPSTTASPTGR
jgi:hypothetical protein